MGAKRSGPNGLTISILQSPIKAGGNESRPCNVWRISILQSPIKAVAALVVERHLEISILQSPIKARASIATSNLSVISILQSPIKASLVSGAYQRKTDFNSTKSD